MLSGCTAQGASDFWNDPGWNDLRPGILGSANDYSYPMYDESEGDDDEDEEDESGPTGSVGG